MRRGSGLRTYRHLSVAESGRGLDEILGDSPPAASSHSAIRRASLDPTRLRWPASWMAPRVECSASLSVKQPQVWHNLPLGHHHRPATRTEHPVSRSEAGQRDWVGLLPAGLAPLTGQYKAGVHLLEVSQMGTDTGPDVRTSPGVALPGRSIVRSLYVRCWRCRGAGNGPPG